MNNTPISPEPGTVICPNCGSNHMEEVCHPLANMDRLEWHSFITTALVSSALVLSLGQQITNLFGVSRILTGAFGYVLAGLLILLAISFSYRWIADLSMERYRHDGICVWYVRCARCHCRYRVVRPLGTVPPWEAEEDTMEGAYEEMPQTDAAAADF